MFVEDIESPIKEKLRRQPISSRILLDSLRMLDEASRRTSQYQDPNYLPFYYYLSRLATPKVLLQIGLDLALPLCCFLKGCDSLERLILFQRKDKSFYSPRIAISNIKDVRPKGLSVEYHYGFINDEELEKSAKTGVDIALITTRMGGDEISEALDLCWKFLNVDGLMVLDHAGEKKLGEVFRAFCKAQNRPCVFFDTRYGNAITQK